MKHLNLKKRSEFLCVKQHGQVEKFPHFIMQFYLRKNDTSPTLRFGYTASKRVGNAPVRNKAKRRLREVVRLFCKTTNFPLKLSFDCVLIARTSCATAPFSSLEEHFSKAMTKVFDQHDGHIVPLEKETP